MTALAAGASGEFADWQMSNCMPDASRASRRSRSPLAKILYHPEAIEFAVAPIEGPKLSARGNIGRHAPKTTLGHRRQRKTSYRIDWHPSPA
jgi:hypothetical protein